MNKNSFKNLCALLTDKGVVFEVIKHKPVFTMNDVIRELKIPQEAMAKTLLLVVSGKEILRVILPGTSHLDFRKLASIINVSRSDIHLADKTIIERIGFTVGAIPPFGGDLPTYIDKSLLNQDVLYCGAGDNDKTFSLRKDDLILMSSALVVEITRT